MKIEKFEESLRDDAPPAELNSYLKALWYDARDEWKKAHEIVQDLNDRNAAWIHAYLHRREGDEGNASYWYRQASKPFPTGIKLEDEWRDIVSCLL